MSPELPSTIAQFVLEHLWVTPFVLGLTAWVKKVVPMSERVRDVVLPMVALLWTGAFVLAQELLTDQLFITSVGILALWGGLTGIVSYTNSLKQPQEEIKVA